jgi:hypothetical protein
MPFRLSGLIAGGASDAFQELLKQRMYEAELAAREQERQQERLERQQERQQELAYRAQQTARQKRLDELSEARTIAELADVQFDPQTGLPVALTAEQATTLGKTPYGTRVRTSGPTLEARAVVPELAGSIQEQPQIVSELLPTGAQRAARTKYVQEQATKQELARLAADPNTPPRVRQILNLQRVGAETAPIGAEALKTPEDIAAETTRAFEEWRRKEDYQDRLMRARAAETAARAGQKGLTPQDRVQAMRQARQDAIRAYEAEAGPVGKVIDPVTKQVISLDSYIDEYVNDFMQAVEEAAGEEEAPARGKEPSGAALVPSGATRTPSGPMLSPAGTSLMPSGATVTPARPGQNAPLSVTLGRAPRAAAGAPAAPSRRPARQPAQGPRVGERRTINGELAEWNGQAWVAVR